jgi:hypothetical protein
MLTGCPKNGVNYYTSKYCEIFGKYVRYECEIKEAELIRDHYESKRTELIGDHVEGRSKQ